MYYLLNSVPSTGTVGGASIFCEIPVYISLHWTQDMYAVKPVLKTTCLERPLFLATKSAFFIVIQVC